MATYNIAKSKGKNLDDTHINMRLKDHHDKAPETITQQQLEKKDRVGEKEVLLERLLDQARTGSAQVIIEKNLSDSKGLFGTKHRNDETSIGDINKLEEKRIDGKKTEDEKYKAASETPKQLRWWDHLKKASSLNPIKTAKIDNTEELDFADSGKSFDRLKEMTGDDEEEGVLHDTIVDDIDEEADELGTKDSLRQNLQTPTVYITQNRETTSPFASVFMEMSFDREDFKNDEESIKVAALEKAIEARPSLRGKISIEDLSAIQNTGIDSTIKLRLIGEEYLMSSQPSEDDSDSPFVDVQSEEIDMGGTPMSVGRVTLSPMAEGMDEDSLARDVVDYIAESTGIEVPANSIQINREKGEITFAISSNVSDVSDVEDEAIDSQDTQNASPDTNFDVSDSAIEKDTEMSLEPETPEDLTNPEPSITQEDLLTPKASKLHNFKVVEAEEKDVDSKKN